MKLKNFYDTNGTTARVVSETITHYQCPVKPVSLFQTHRSYECCPFKIFLGTKTWHPKSLSIWSNPNLDIKLRTIYASLLCYEHTAVIWIALFNCIIVLYTAYKPGRWTWSIWRNTECSTVKRSYPWNKLLEIVKRPRSKDVHS